MVNCIVVGCSNTTNNKNGNCSFSRLQKQTNENEKVRRKHWIHAIGRDDVEKLKNPSLCSEHFEAGQFQRNLQNELLPPDAPSRCVCQEQSSNCSRTYSRGR